MAIRLAIITFVASVVDVPLDAVVALLTASVTLVVRCLREIVAPPFVSVRGGVPLGAVLARLEVLLVVAFAPRPLFGGLLSATVLLAALGLFVLLAPAFLLLAELLRSVGALLLWVLSSRLIFVAARRTAALAAEGASGPMVSLPGPRLVRLLAHLSPRLLGIASLVTALLLACLRRVVLLLTAMRESSLSLLTLGNLLVLLISGLLYAPLLALEAPLASRLGLLAASLLLGLRLASLLRLLSTLLRAGPRSRPLLRLPPRELALLLTRVLTR